MTRDQFNALRRWIDARSQLWALINDRPRDAPFVAARLRELDEFDEEAMSVLVDPEPEPGTTLEELL